MQSTNAAMNAKEIESTATRCRRTRLTLKAVMEVLARPGVFVLLFIASLTYIGYGATYEGLSPFEPETSIAALALRPEDTDHGRRDESVHSIFSLSSEKLFLPSDPVKLR